MMEWGVTYDVRVASEPYNRTYACVGPRQSDEMEHEIPNENRVI